MDKELVISSSDEGVQIALLEDKRLVELHKEMSSGQYAVGDIFFGKVKKIMQGLNAAFVDLGGDKEGFMHYLDLGPDYRSVDKYLRLSMNGDASAATLNNFKIEPILEKVGNLNDVLKPNQPVLVQVTKEPISTKGPKVTGDISIAGRYLVLTPFSNKVSISQKIKKNDERNRLRRLMQSIRPQNFGVIVRTVAEGRTVAELDADLHHLMDCWAKMTEKLKRVNSPAKVHAELDTTTALLRDVLTDDFATIYVDNADIYAEVRQFLKEIEPGKEDIVKLYKMETPIFEQFGISRDIRRAFGKIVTIRSGVYLYIEHTEAMHVIDVNSGNHIKAGTGQELDVRLSDNSDEAQEAFSVGLLDDSRIVAVSFLNQNVSDFKNMLNALNMVVVVMIVCASGLAFVVLYNLTNINIAERVREIATFKVLGFYNNETSRFIYRENILLTLMGIAAGLVLGVFLTGFIIRTVEVDNVMFGRDIYLSTYVYASLLTMAFSLLVNFFMSFKIKAVNMVESLKSVE